MQAEWSKCARKRAIARKVSEAQRRLKRERGRQLSLDDLATSTREAHGELVAKDVTIAAPVARPDGSVDRTLVVTHAARRADRRPPVDAKWIITGTRRDVGTAGRRALSLPSR